MAMEYLGESFDLHAGGEDLIFPHHENEIAQSESVTHKAFARHWMHVRFLLVDGRKTLGEIVDIILQEYDVKAGKWILNQVLNELDDEIQPWAWWKKYNCPSHS